MDALLVICGLLFAVAGSPLLAVIPWMIVRLELDDIQ